jgi:endonuclease YncB( thermonuclease family)
MARAPARSSKRLPRGLHVWLGLLLCAVAAAARAGFVEGRVIAVFDGDTLEVRIGEQNRRIRIAGIDTPERGQPWAERAKQALSARVFGKQVRINQVAVDRYGRTVGEVYAEDVCVGCELVRDGHAWVYRGFSDDPVLLELEAQARAARRGLWGLPEADRTPPWEWRRARRAGRSRAEEPSAPAFVCGAKVSCREMASCREARFHLASCAVTTLDGDGDGVPCEALCRDQ